MKSVYDELQRCVVLSPEGRMLRMRVEIDDLGPRDDLLLKAAGEAAGVPLRNLCELPNTDMPVHFYAAASPSMAVRMKSIRLNTFWTVELGANELPTIVPNFAPAKAIDRALEWVPPPDCAVYLVVRSETPYLVAIGPHPTKGNWRAVRLDLPNLFADAKICMGDGWRPPEQEGSYISRLRKYVDSVHSSRWNTHLMENGVADTRWASSKKLVRFDMEGKCLPPSEPWYNCGKEVAHSAYNWLVLMAQANGRAP